MAFGRFSQMRTGGTSPPFLEQKGETPVKPLLLVVDDDLRIRQGLKLNLEKSYRVHLCASGEEGIQAVSEDVDVMILDIKMPGKDGLQVYKAVKAKFPHLPIIFYSAYQSVLEGIELSQQYKPFNYIDKSADVQELLETVKRAVTYAQAYRQLRKTEEHLHHVREGP